REFHLLRSLRTLGLPVPAPYAACYRQRGARYKAAILVARIVAARSFAAQVSSTPSQASWAAVGSAIGRFHRLGAHHADLNSHNVLLDGSGAVWLIDWDKGRQENSAGPWCVRVLARLQRSLRKQCPRLSGGELDQGMRLLRAAHDRALAA
ncbi:MAG: 3-deoxy-D-manno-octulosonic acid kinase, partial [Arenimonas sp.]